MNAGRMDIGLLLPLPLSTRGYLIYQALGSVLVNGILNFASAWPMHRHPWIPLFGWSGSITFDTCSTAVLLSGLTVLSGSWFVRRDHRSGVVRPIDPPANSRLRWLPLGTVPRALLFGVLFAALTVPIGLGILLLRGCQGMTFPQFLAFKLVFAVALGALVTPLNAAAVLMSLPKPA
jgi:hypothetical protein